MHWRRQFTCLKLFVNVRVAVHIRTSMTSAQLRAPAPLAAHTHAHAHASGSDGDGGTGGFGAACRRANKPHSGLSSILIINLLFLLLLSLCCDVCKSNEFPLTSNNDSGGDSGSGSATTGSPSRAPAVIDAINLRNPYSTTLSVADNSNDATVAAATRECLEHCRVEQNVFSNEYGLNCSQHTKNAFCFTPRCSKGCEQWWRALNEFEPCPKACMSALPKLVDLPCISACESAQRRYWQMRRPQMELALRTIAPKIVSDNATSDALTLQWDVQLPDTYLAHYPFVIQFRSVDKSELRAKKANNNKNQNTINIDGMKGSEDARRWQRLTDYNCNEIFECELRNGLMPYTSYRFRFELRFGDGIDDVLYSFPTAVHKTLGHGAPISQPLLQSAFALDGSRVCVFWKPGKFANGPLMGYKVTIKSVDNVVEKLLAPSMNEFTIDGLTPGYSYAVQIAMINTDGVGPAVETFITTKELRLRSNDFAGFNWLIVAGEYTIKLKNLEPLAQTKLLFISENLISDYDLFVSEQRLFVIDVESTISSVLVTDKIEKNTVTLKEQLDGFKASKISVDWLNKRLFFAGKLPSKSWAIATTDFDGSSVEILAQNLSLPIKQLQVDPINGWLFWRQTDGLMRMNLASNVIAPIHIEADIDIGYFKNDFQRNLLMAYSRQDSELYELTYSGAYVHSMQLKSMWVLQGELQNFWHIGSSILATNGTHLMRQNFDTNENDVWPIREIEWCSSVFPLLPNYNVQPHPVASGRPEQLHAVLGVSRAKITWQPPLRNAFQTASAWQQWQYELEIMDVVSNSAFSIRNIKTTHFDVEKLQANNFYKLRVRATGAAGEAGAWSDELLTRTWPLGDHRFLLAGQDGLYESLESGDQLRRIDALPPMRDFVQLNGSFYYVTADKQLRCANIVHPELNCSFAAANAVSVAYEWRGGKLYWADVLKNCVVRANIDGSERELLPAFGAQHIRVDSLAGHLYYTTGTRLVRRLLSGGEETPEEEYYDVGGVGAQIRGFAVDLARQQVYWVVRQQDGEVRLCRAALDNQRKGEEKVLTHDIAFGSLQYLADIDSLMWLVADSGRIVLTRIDAWSDETWIEWSHLTQVNHVQLRRDYTPPMDWSVVPAPINGSSVRTEYAYDDAISLKWSPSSTADNHTVLYRVLAEQDEELVPKQELTASTVRLDGLREPLNVSVTPYTAWSVGATVQVLLTAESWAPVQPKRLRVYVQRLDGPLQLESNVSVLVRWDAPKNVLGSTDISYTVHCWLGGELVAQRVYNDSANMALQVAFNELHIGETYRFQVQAYAGGRTSGSSKSAFYEWHIDPEVQSLPHVLYTTSNYIAELDLDWGSTQVLVYTSSEVEHLVVLQGEERLLWVNENVELLSFVPGSKPVKLARMRAEVLSLAVDWVQRIVYWAEMDTYVEHTVSIYQLDLCQFEGRVMLPNKLFTIEGAHTIRDLIVFPHSKVLLWLQLELGQANGTLAGFNLTDFSALQLASEHRNVRLFPGYSTAEMETVNVVDVSGKTYAYDVQRQMYSVQKIYFDVLDEELKHIDRDDGYIYSLSNNTVRAYDRRKQQVQFQSYANNSRHIRAYNYQPYPERKCLLPLEADALRNKALPGVSVKAYGERFLSLELPVLSSLVDCAVDPPGLKYTVVFRDCSNNTTRNYTTHQRQLNITQLQPFTSYSLQLVVFSYYQEKLRQPPLRSDAVVVRTAVGAPFAPRNFTCYALSPTQIHVSWAAPLQLNAEQVWYQLHWQAEGSELGAHMRLNQTSVTLLQLAAAQQYTIWLKVFSADDKFNNTSPVTLKTFEAPSALHMVEKTAYNFTLSWSPTPNVTRAILVCRSLAGADKIGLDVTENAAHINVTHLMPKTKYELFFQLFYGTDLDPYIWPEERSKRFVYETLGDAPSPPGRPQVEHITGEIFKVSWESARNNGEAIVEYSLEALQARYSKRIRREQLLDKTDAKYNNATKMMQNNLLWADEAQPIEDTWVVYCSTVERSCIVRDLHTMRFLKFRVRARNEPYGWGPYSEDSDRVSEPFVSPEKRDSLVLAIITPAAVVSSCVVIVVILRLVHLRRQRAKKLLEKSRPSIWSNASGLQHQQMMAARNRAFSLTSNSTLYTGGPLTDADIALLPHINRSQITLLNFLGSGAFGEVFEGLLKHDDDEEPEKVAIKTLRNGASEFVELLQEAQLMSNFRHENIVRLIGVCFDIESISIIMEYMEGGDLQTYLRETRPNSNGNSYATLQLLDLIGMCIDVATGCAYLEDMHFVHRDLACRNCLVSSRIPSKRVVKIGDFGLARDIYRNDYYRKEGEGMLPVRWMAPESLVDGVFTTQSDVWAFGVLCWEILTLGQQPYVARNNFEVLNFVKEGGRLEKPENCPDKLFVLLSQCWSIDPEERPSFRRCLNTLLTIKTDVRRVSLGYNMDDVDCAVYANNNGIILSSFLAGPLPKVVEEEDTRESCVTAASDDSSEKIHLEHFYNDVEIETASENSALGTDEQPKDKQQGNFKNIEGISRF